MPAFRLSLRVFFLVDLPPAAGKRLFMFINPPRLGSRDAREFIVYCIRFFFFSGHSDSGCQQEKQTIE
jgi:hypothetical protein